MKTKGLILAGGKGTRLYPMTTIASKQLLPIYDKPMIYYPLATLMLGGIREYFLLSTPNDLPLYQELLGDGSQWGISIEYCAQTKPGGIAEAYLYAESFIGAAQTALILGDNLFYGNLDFFRNALNANNGGTIFAYRVNNPQDYGVVEFNDDGEVISIEEKPINPKSQFAIPGLYVFDGKAVEIAKTIKPSNRGELEITEIQNEYLQRGELNVKEIGRGFAWLDTGSPESLIEAGAFIHAIEKRQGSKIACLEEIAYNQNFIDKKSFFALIDKMPKSSYRSYCERIESGK